MSPDERAEAKEGGGRGLVSPDARDGKLRELELELTNAREATADRLWIAPDPYLRLYGLQYEDDH